MNRIRTGLMLVLLLVFVGANVSLAEEPKKEESNPFQGTWLFDKAARGKASQLTGVWYSQLTVTRDRFSISKFLDLEKPLTGKFIFNSKTNPQSIDLKLDEYEISEDGLTITIPSCTLPGIYQIEGDRLQIHFPMQVDGKRPESFETKGDRLMEMELVKAPADFKEFPKQISVKVTGMDRQPVNGATITTIMTRQENREKKEEKPQWVYEDSVKTNTNGIAKVEYEKLRNCSIIVHDIPQNQMRITPISPVSLLKGEVNVPLKPACRVSGELICEQLKNLGKPIEWTNVYLIEGDKTIARCSSFQGKFEFIVPPGNYTLSAHGSDLKRKEITMTVPPDKSTWIVEPIHLKATSFVSLQGQPAPELKGIVGWKGKKVKLSDLKGKYVLLDFWGHWCGPCVYSMPVLIELHEKYADKGLAIVGVHFDNDGEIDTEAKLDEKLTSIRKGLWKGKDLPFPTALVNGTPKGEGDNRTRGVTAEQYGILGYPTTILIDKEGKVVGKFHARDIKDASEKIEKLLKKEK
jgi:uncharacterized protein (TIGR03067 family)